MGILPMLTARGGRTSRSSTVIFTGRMPVPQHTPAMLILGIESTCDETAASVVENGTRVRSNTIATQFDLHRKYRGVVPEIASRAHIENLLPVLREALDQAGVTL